MRRESPRHQLLAAPDSPKMATGAMLCARSRGHRPQLEHRGAFTHSRAIAVPVADTPRAAASSALLHAERTSARSARDRPASAGNRRRRLERGDGVLCAAVGGDDCDRRPLRVATSRTSQARPSAAACRERKRIAVRLKRSRACPVIQTCRHPASRTSVKARSSRKSASCRRRAPRSERRVPGSGDSFIPG